MSSLELFYMMFFFLLTHYIINIKIK